MRIRAVARVVVACVVVLTVPQVAGAASVQVQRPVEHGVVHLGQRVQVALDGPCRRAISRVNVRFGETTVVGKGVRGCRPVVTVPEEAKLAGRGYRPGEPLQITLHAAQTTRRLAPWRVQPAEMTAVTDPFEQGTGAEMRAGDALDLGEVHLGGIHSVNVRNLSALTGAWALRAGSATGPAIASGLLGMPGSLFSAGAAGWYHSVARLEAPKGHPTLKARRLFLVLVAGSATVNFVDFNGPGAGLAHRFADDEGFEMLFDGSSFDGWRHSGPGRFELRDGAMRAEHELHDRGWGWQWYAKEQFTDFVLRLRFKVEDWEDNGGVLLRHIDPAGDNNEMTGSGDEVQIQEGFENHTGGVAHEADAYRLATNMVGQWNNLEVVAAGALYVIRINGIEVQRFTSKKLKRGYIAVENEQLGGTKGGHLSYDDIRIRRCAADACPGPE